MGAGRAGKQRHRSLPAQPAVHPRRGRPAYIQAELYRANEIESYDTAALRLRTQAGVEVSFYTTHAVPSHFGPLIHYHFAEAELYGQVPGSLYARMRDGGVIDYGYPEKSPGDKIHDTIQAIRAGEPPACSVQEASNQTLAICGAHESAPIAEVPRVLVRQTLADPGVDDQLTWVDGLQGALVQCFSQRILPAEHGGFSWARAGQVVDLEGYRSYPGG